MAFPSVRTAVFGYEDGSIGVEPMLSSVVCLAAMSADEPLMSELRRRLNVVPGAPGDPFEGRKIVSFVDDGVDRPTVVPDIFGVTDDSLSQYEDDAGSDYTGEVYDEKKKIFDLGQIFSDTNVSDKLRFTARFLQYLKRMALEQPGRAAAVLQDRLQKGGYPRYLINAGRYAKSKSHASSRLVAAAAASRIVCVSVAAEVAGDKLFMHQTGKDGLIEWSVYGPMRSATAIRAVFQLCIANGIHEPVFAFSLDLQILDITVVDAVSGMAISPSFVQHVAPFGIEPEGHGIPDGLPEDIRTALVAHEPCVVPVTCDGLVIGSAVRVTARYLLINEHVLNYETETTEESEGSVGGFAPTESENFGPSKLRIAGRKFTQRNAISKDLWVVEMQGEANGWVYREPRIGEKVIMCYSVGDGLVEYTSVSRVQTYDQNMFAVTRFPQARSGTSGGVVISVADGALLGLYSGEALISSMCSAFSPMHFGGLSELDALSDSVTPSDTTERLYERVEARGLRAVIERVMASLVPLYTSTGFKGVAVGFDDKYYTTVSPDEEQLTAREGKSSLPIVFDRADRERYVSRSGLAVGAVQRTSVSFTRSVELNERVFVLSRDAEGPYLSASRRVEHVGASGDIFHVKDFGFSQLPFEGGVVIAERDGAVVGQFVSRVDGSGAQVDVKRASCYGVPVNLRVATNPMVDSVRRVTEGIEVKFPFLNALTWSPTVVYDVFTHGSVRTTGNAMERFAAVGLAAARVQSLRSMNNVGLAHKEWNDVWKVMQSNTRLIDVCHDVGLAQLLIAAPHTHVGRSSRVYADLLAAFLGLIVEFEPGDTFVEVCKVLGLLYDANTPVAQVSFSHRSRSVSPANSVPSVASARTSFVAPVTPTQGAPLAVQVASMQAQLDEIRRMAVSAESEEEPQLGEGPGG